MACAELAIAARRSDGVSSLAAETFGVSGDWEATEFTSVEVHHRPSRYPRFRTSFGSPACLRQGGRAEVISRIASRLG